MANTKSAQKAIRKTKRNTERNRASRSRLRTALKKFRALLASKDMEKAKGAWPNMASLIDRSVKRGILHHRTAARTKSRLAVALNRLKTA